MSVAVKICGVTSPEDARAAAEAGADAVGLVFWPPSPRYVEPARARAVAAALPPFVARVGVFVDESASRIGEIADLVGLDVVQLHGSEPPELLDELPRRALKALRVTEELRADAVLPWSGRAGILLDRGSAERPGGTGQSFDWSRVAEVRRAVTYLVLAGGLGPDNVAAAVRQVRPDAVDVSTGVEARPGVKDAAKLRAFVAAVRSAEKGGAR